MYMQNVTSKSCADSPVEGAAASMAALLSSVDRLAFFAGRMAPEALAKVQYAEAFVGILRNRISEVEGALTSLSKIRPFVDSPAPLISDEMVVAGERVLADGLETCSSFVLVKEIYTLMWLHRQRPSSSSTARKASP